MKKHLLFYLLFVLLAMNARAQSTTVTIGTGTTSSSLYGPLFVDKVAGGHTSKYAAIYKATEIKATPFSEQVLTKIAWNKTDTSRYTKNNGVLKIYIKNTTAATIAVNQFFEASCAKELAGTTLVYSNSTQNIGSGAGWKEFTLNTPFFWNGTDNLEVVVDWSEPGVSTGTAAMTWASTSVSTAVSAYASDPFTPDPIFPQNFRPNVQLTFSSFPNDAGISAITAPATPVITPGSNPVEVTVKNYGNNALTSATIGWKVNGVAQTDIPWTGNLAAGVASATSTLLGNFTFPFGASTIKAYTKNANGVTDPNTGNDTTIFKVIACTAISGNNYTINKNAPSSATNFRSFAEAAQILNSCGVNGAVTITVAPGSGPYNENLELKNVSGVSATNTITFEGNGNTLMANLPTNTSAAIKIDGVQYVKLNNLVVTATSTFTQGYGIQFMNLSHNATVTNCTVNMPFASGQNFVGLLIGVTHNGAGDNSSNSLFQNNIVNGSGFSMRVNGKAPVAPATTPTGAINVSIIGNQFKDFANNGLFLQNADGAIIQDNDFTRPTLTNAGAFAGVTLATGCIKTVINKNRFHNTHGAATSKTSGVTAIDVQIAAPFGSENIVKNNLIYDLNNTGPITALYASSAADGVYFYNNTVSIERTVASTSDQKAFSLGTPGANIKFINNIVTINSAGTGIKTAMFYQNFNSATAPIALSFVSNNNVFYIAPGQTNAFVGYLLTPAPVTTATTLAAWRAVNAITPYDMNSVVAFPGFTDLATGNLKPTNSAINNMGQALVAVTDDILGAARNATTPDPGAYEFTPAADDAGVSAITGPISACDLTNQETITIIVNNFGTAAISNVPVSYAINGGTPVTAIVAGPIAPGATVTYSFTTKANLTAPGPYTIVASTSLAGDAVATNNAFTKVVVPAVTPAIPTITASGPVTFCAGGSVTLTAASTTTGAAFTWYKNGVVISGANAATYFISTAIGPGSYTAVATTGTCSSAASAATIVTVNATPAVPTITAGGPVTFCAGGSVTLTAASTTTGATYTWTLNNTAITGATAATYTATTAGSYRAVATSGTCSSAASTATTVTVNALPAVPTITAGGPTTFCTGGTVVLTAASTTTGATYTWFNNGTLITGATAATYSATTAGNYTAVATANGCSSAASTATTVTVNPIAAVPTITAGGSTTFCAGGSVTLTAASTTTGATFQWFNNGTAISGATASTYAANASGSYTVVATAGNCSSAASAATTVTVNAAIVVPTITASGPTTFCTGGTVVLTAASTTTGATCTWFKNGVLISGATSATYSATTAGNYTAVAAANGCSSAASTATTVTVNAIPTVPTITAGGSTTFCAGGSVTLTAASTTTGATYTWSLNGTAISGATSATFIANAAGNYTAIATTGGCPATSTATAVTVNPLPATPTVTRLNMVLTSSSATGNQWYLNGVAIPGATGTTHTVSANGNYTVIVTTNGCPSVASNTENVTNTGVKDNVLAAQLNVFPNPSNGLFNVSLPQGKAYQLEVTDLSGKIIHRQAAKGETQLKLENTAKGIYLLKVTGENGMAIRKLIVE